MITPRLSVVVPAYNESAYIESCLRALSAQDDPIDEVLVVDNNSDDDTAAIVERIAAEDSRIKLIRESRQGVAYARNTGFDLASGDIIGRIDADTRVDSSWSAAVKAGFTDPENADVDSLTGLAYVYDSPFENFSRARIDKAVRRGRLGGGRRVANILGANCAIRKSSWEKVRDSVSTRTDIHEDIDLALCIVLGGGQIAQLETFRASVSARRNLTNPWKHFRSYILAGPRTLRQHNARRLRTWVPFIIGLAGEILGHTLLWLPHRAYDPIQRKFTLRSLIAGQRARTSPTTEKAAPDHGSRTTP